MGNFSELISYCDDLVDCLKEKKDSNGFTKCFDDINALNSTCDSDFDKSRSSLQDYLSKIDACKQKTEAAKSEVVSDEELEILQKELEEEHRKESLLLEELRVITADIADLERMRISTQVRKRAMKKLQQNEFSAQRNLSMLASVTHIIPDLSDPSYASGHIVDRDKKMVKKFEFDTTQMTGFDTCDNIWKMINP